MHTTVFGVAVDGKRAVGRQLLIATAFMCATLALQHSAGAYGSERASFPDEAGHFMNALLVRDYFRDGVGQNPITFAEHYYVHYPKIAPVMWPPLSATILGVTMLPAWSPQIAPFMLLAAMQA